MIFGVKAACCVSRHFSVTFLTRGNNKEALSADKRASTVTDYMRRKPYACIGETVLLISPYVSIRLPLSYFHTIVNRCSFHGNMLSPSVGTMVTLAEKKTFWLVESHIRLGCCAHGWIQTGGRGERIPGLISVSISWSSAEPDTRSSLSPSHTDTLSDSYVVSPT